MAPIELVVYLRGDNEEITEAAEKAGLSEVAVDRVGGALHEVRVTLLVSPETGNWVIKTFEEL